MPVCIGAGERIVKGRIMNRILEGTDYPLDPDALSEDDLTARRTGTYAD